MHFAATLCFRLAFHATLRNTKIVAAPRDRVLRSLHASGAVHPGPSLDARASLGLGRRPATRAQDAALLRGGGGRRPRTHPPRPAHGRSGPAASLSAPRRRRISARLSV